jgi:hypothetical protein
VRVRKEHGYDQHLSNGLGGDPNIDGWTFGVPYYVGPIKNIAFDYLVMFGQHREDIL